MIKFWGYLKSVYALNNSQKPLLSHKDLSSRAMGAQSINQTLLGCVLRHSSQWAKPSRHTRPDGTRFRGTTLISQFPQGCHGVGKCKRLWSCWIHAVVSIKTIFKLDRHHRPPTSVSTLSLKMGIVCGKGKSLWNLCEIIPFRSIIKGCPFATHNNTVETSSKQGWSITALLYSWSHSWLHHDTISYCAFKHVTVSTMNNWIGSISLDRKFSV